MSFYLNRKKLLVHKNLIFFTRLKAAFEHNPFYVLIGACGGSKGGESDDSNANTLLGYALYFYTYSTWKGKALYLEDLYITRGCRGQGLGSALFNRVAKVRIH
jgi:diamine N-acetyltransferase